jgi:hypothetical protein
MAKSRAKLAELETLEGGGAGGMGGGSGVGGTRWSNLPSFKGKANTIDDIKRLSKDTSKLKGTSKEIADEAKQRAASRTAVRVAGVAGVGAAGKAAMSGDEPTEKPSRDTDEDNFQETRRIMREVDEDIKGSKYGKADGMKSGGSVTASKRADGIAQRGKTRGKMC